MSQEDTMLIKLLSVDEVLAHVPVSRTTLFRMEREKRFPSGRLVNGRKVWPEHDVARWQRELPKSAVQPVSIVPMPRKKPV